MALAPLPLARDSRDLLDELAISAWRWFVANTHTQTGMTLDRAANARPANPGAMASIASTGFYLSLLPDAVRRKLNTRAEAVSRARLTMRFAAESVDHVEGIMTHFFDWSTGKHWGECEFSVLDTSIFLHGCITAAVAFPEVAQLADQLLDRVNWQKLFIVDPQNRALLRYGYHGKTRELLDARGDVRSSENLMPCILAAGSRTHRVDRRCWYHMNIVRRGVRESDPKDLDRTFRNLLNPTHGLFTSYYGLCWMDLRGLHDAEGVDLWTNATIAARYNRWRCGTALAERSQTYRPENGGWWGISAGDSPAGYVAPNPDDGDPDGTVWPTAALGAITWAPAELAQDILNWRKSPWWTRARGAYGLAPFSIDRNWVGNDLIGIDIGSFAAVWANAMYNSIHPLWSQHPVAKRGLAALEFSHP